jgi:hypothetical protein
VGDENKLSEKKLHPNANLHGSNNKRAKNIISDSETSDIEQLISGKKKDPKTSKKKIIEDSDEAASDDDDYQPDDLDSYKF